jgi:hypothetical protein
MRLTLHQLRSTHVVSAAVVGEAQSSQRGGSTSSSSSRTASKSAADLRSRSVVHCLRALCTLRSAQVAEELVRSAVVGPLARYENHPFSNILRIH